MFSGLPAEDADMLDLGVTLGVTLGENHAFGLVAGRSAAAQAAAIKRLREEKKYRRFTPHWNEFCPKFLKMSGSQADKIIRLLEEFGAMHERLAEIDQRCAAIMGEFQEISRKERHGENWILFTATLSRMCSALARIKQENGLG
jgi:hypothetical protein